MDVGMAVYLMNSGIFQTLLLSAPMLVIGVAIGLVISIFQATTSIQDQTLSFVPKIIGILGSLVVFGPWMFASLKQYTINLMEMIPLMVR